MIKCNKYISPQAGIESHSLILSLIVFQELVLATTLVTDAKSGRNFQYKTESRYVQWVLIAIQHINIFVSHTRKPKMNWNEDCKDEQFNRFMTVDAIPWNNYNFYSKIVIIRSVEI